MIRAANAPCSWWMLEFETSARHAPAVQVLDEMADNGYAGTEHRDRGFLPTEPSLPAADIERRHPDVARAARAEGWDHHTAVCRGIFCELERGMVPFAAVLDTVRGHAYSGWILVEHDVQPGLGTPSAIAARNRACLRRLGL